MNALLRLPQSAVPLLCLAASLALAAPGRSAPPAPTATKPYTLFVGVDFDVEQNHQFYRVQNVIGSSVVVSVNGGERRIPMNDQSVNLRITESLKLTDAAVTIAGFKGERAYTPAADPGRKWAKMTITSDPTAALTQNANAQDAYRQNVAQANDPTLRPEMRAAISQMTPTLYAAANSAADNLAQANDLGRSDMANPGYNSMRMEAELAKKLYDAIDVSFAVSSPQPLTDAYLVVLAQYHDPHEAQGTARNWIFAQALGAVDDRPRQIQIRHGGFPPGYTLEKVSVHVYDHGRELASNVAGRRTQLTSDEAFQYLVIDYLASHKDSTLPPTLAMGRLPAAARAGLSAEQLARVYYVKVSKDGLPAGSFLNEACSRKTNDPSLEAIIQQCRFRPALTKGRPVEGVAQISLRDLKQ